MSQSIYYIVTEYILYRNVSNTYDANFTKIFFIIDVWQDPGYTFVLVLKIKVIKDQKGLICNLFNSAKSF